MSRTLLLTAACAVLMAAFGASSAIAQPTGEYAVFAQCPYKNPEVNGCIVARTESGEIKVGNTGVPIVNTQTLQGGTHNTSLYTESFVGATNGETFTKVSQRVPGGLLGIKCAEIKGEEKHEKELRKACEKTFEEGALGVYATTELALPASDIGISSVNLGLEEGVGLYLPVKVKLENALFGSACYIGSSSEPIKLELTSGTSGSLKGKFGKSKSKAGGGILEITGDSVVDSNFSAPGASGCGLFGLLDSVIDAKLGIPATTGNTAVLNNTIELASAELVQESEI